MNNIDLYKKIEYLFNRYWDEDLPDEDQDKLEQYADELVAEYGWDKVYENAVLYLHTNCRTPESAVNFANNYWTYGWYENPIPDPHKFLAYFYYITDYDTQKYDPMD
ncbi:MAG: hypothetical protein II016_00040, partial [Erysipelotrichaceae bacterium]|nr:hypothetical protein [Erysipelotrichaceae bacterium]